MIVECPACHSRYDVTGRPPGTRARCRCGQTFVLPSPSAEAARLACPGCGASVDPASSRCEYCRADLKVKACPRCFARVFVGSRHCNECGAEIDIPARAEPDGSAAQRRCPRCESSTLDARLVGDVLVDECPDCHGIWLDVNAVERVVRERRQASVEALVGTDAPSPAAATPAVLPGRLYVKCPDCETVMNRVNFGRRSGIIIDTCRAHGTWFDANELPAVIRFVMRGGLEESARREAQELKDEARRIRSDAEVMRIQSTINADPRWGGDAAAFGSMLSSIARILRG